MPKNHPISISTETHGLAGNLILPDQASKDSPAPGAIVIGGPGPMPLQRYTAEGAKQWPVQWTEALGEAGLAGLCYDQRGSGLSTGQYEDADWSDLYDDAVAALDLLKVQPEVGKVAAISWAEGCHFALQLAAEGKVDALVLLAPAYHNAEERYAASIAALAARKGLSERVVKVRVDQWKSEVMALAKRVEQGETKTTTDLGGQQVTTNLVRFLQTIAFDPGAVARQVKVPVLVLHGEDDTAIPPSESELLARAVPGPCDRITYRGVAHFLYRHPKAMKDAVDWLKKTLARD